MVVGVQIVGILFGLIMVYLTYLFYRKNNYSKTSFFFWLLVWGGFILTTLFPTTLYGIMDELSIQRTVDFFVIAGFMFFAAVIFYLFTVIKRVEATVERLVRKVAIDQPKKQKKSTR